ncbi:MAG TPA: cyanophycin synthetase, partial [Polyangiaceae bacterium]
LIVANAADPMVREVTRSARAPVTYFALQGEDTGGLPAHWLAAPAQVTSEATTFDLFAGGVAAGRLALRIPGRHNLKNALAALAATLEGFGAKAPGLLAALADFEGVRRRQELLGTPSGIHVYDDFAHHPTAVAETLAALRARHPTGRLIVVFEPKSATACRRVHQAEYPRAFAAADAVLLAPLGRANLPADVALDLEALASDVRALGRHAERAATRDEIPSRLAALARPGDVVALLSNGSFADVARRVLEQLA